MTGLWIFVNNRVWLVKTVTTTEENEDCWSNAVKSFKIM